MKCGKEIANAWKTYFWKQDFSSAWVFANACMVYMDKKILFKALVIDS